MTAEARVNVYVNFSDVDKNLVKLGLFDKELGNRGLINQFQ